MPAGRGWATAEVSPFTFDTPLAAEGVVGRDREAEVLRAWARAARFTSLYAPRRFGKTSLLRKVARDIASLDSIPAVIVDLYGVLSMADLVIRLERAYRDHATGKVRQAVTAVMKGGQLGLSLAGAGFSLQLAREPQTDPVPALHSLLDLPRDIAHRARCGRVLIIFDEFQSVLAVEGAEALLRSHLQHQGDVASYIFCGSEPGLLQGMFTDPVRPFYGQVEPKRLGRLEPGALAEAIDAGFEAGARSTGDMLPTLLALADGHPQRAMLLAHCLWTTTPRGRVADEESWARALEDVRERTGREFEAHWDGFSVNQRRLMRGVVRFGSPYRKDAQAALALAKGTVQQVAAGLVDAGELEPGPSGHGLRLVDPLFRLWIDERFD